MDVLELARRLGVEGVQFDLGGPGRGPRLDAAGSVDALRDASAATGVALLGVTANTLNDIGLTAPEGTAAAAEVRRVLARLLDVAHALGVPLVFVPSFRRSAIDGPEGLRRTARVLAWAAAEAEARGLLVASENVLAPDGAVELADRVGSPAFRLLLDTYNPKAAGLAVPGLVEEATRRGVRFADQVHVKDGVAGTDRTPLLGDGDGEVGAALAAVARHLPPPRALVLENDHRDGDEARLALDLARTRTHAERLGRGRTRDDVPNRGDR
ncbi:sugar phosphate isomerase/epimerase family protein [Streptomyces coeruleoprunus]|uniref:Sugar phosphate isomerase/epimerase family protein n=1 Tax=Streptomyces coeruleoprunus TaxID=285563 RepID=A0ABV9XI39_9ACTN